MLQQTMHVPQGPAQRPSLAFCVAMALAMCAMRAFGQSGEAAPALPKTAASVLPAAANAVTAVTTTGGVANQVAKFSGASTVVPSTIYDSGSAIGIGLTAPASGIRLDVNGSVNVRGQVVLPSLGTASSGTSYHSHPMRFVASAYNSSSKTVVGPYFLLQNEPAGNNTSAPSGTLRLLFSNGGGTTAETGFYFNANGTMHFATGQTFPAGTGTGGGTITGVTASTGLTGGGTTGTVTLKVDTNKVPLLAANNIYKGDETINGSQTINGNALVSGTTTMYDAVGIGAAASGDERLYVLGGGSHSNADLGETGIRAMGGPTYDLNTNYAGTGISAVGGTGHSASYGGVGLVAMPGTSDTGKLPQAAIFVGDTEVIGNLSASSKSFKIDHPVDPANKYLVHASVESSEMMNIYTGNVTTGDSGAAVVKLPDWFEIENTDFRYQLTPIGQDARVWISSKVHNGSFQVSSNAPQVEVSWQITAVRQDVYAKAHPMVVEEAKPDGERGFYLYPELHGQPEAKGIEWSRHPQMMKQIEALRQAGAAPRGKAARPATP